MWVAHRGALKFIGEHRSRGADRQERMNDMVIHLEGVKKVFLTDEVETHALAGIDLEIHRGEYISISGPSGCGKSTLLSILGLLDTPTDGSYFRVPVRLIGSAVSSELFERVIAICGVPFGVVPGHLWAAGLCGQSGAKGKANQQEANKAASSHCELEESSRIT